MNKELKDKLEKAIEKSAEKCESSPTAPEAMQYAQAAVNLSNVIIGLSRNDKDME